MRSNRFEVGKRIRKIRGGLTQKQFAEILGIKQNYVSRYERGRIPPPEVLVKIAEFGNVSIDWILVGREKVSEKMGLQIAEEYANYREEELDAALQKLIMKLTPEEKRALIKIIQTLSGGKKPSP